jgi:hypothetical protein
MQTQDEMKAMSFPSLLTIVFVIAKILGLIAWSWWWVFSPLWISVVGGIALLVIIAIFSMFVD